MRIVHCLLPVALMLCAVNSASGQNAAAPIKSQQELEAYLKAGGAEASSPLKYLSPGAQRRFLASLRFGENGLAGYSVRELEEELSDARANEILALIGQSRSKPAQMMSAPRLDPDVRYEAFYAQIELAANAELTARELAQAVRKIHSDYLAGQKSNSEVLRSGAISDIDLRLRMRAAGDALFYTLDPGTAHEMAALTALLNTRGLARDNHFRAVYSALLSVRDFDGARKWQKRHAAIVSDQLPALTQAKGASSAARSEWVVEPGQRTLRRQAVMLAAAQQVIVVGYPLCHFSSNAVHAIQADAALAGALKGRIKWLAPQDRNLDFELLQTWNKENPHAQLSIVHRASEWPEIDTWGTPTFYFLKDGKVLAKVVGWPREGNKAALIEALGKIGVSVPFSPIAGAVQSL